MRILRSGERFLTQREWSLTRHSFSFGGHHDPSNTDFGLLVAHNDEVVRPGPGYRPHEHRAVDIVSWVLDGVLRHEDSAGNVGETASAQLLSAGSGITHSERSASDEPVHFVQMWFRTDGSGAPRYEHADIRARRDALVPVAAWSGDAPLRLRAPGVSVSIASGQVDIPGAPFVHVFVTCGQAEIEGHRLGAGDAARLTDSEAVSFRSVDGDALVIRMGTGRS